MFEKKWDDSQKQEFLSINLKDKNAVDELGKKYNLSFEKVKKKISDFRYIEKQKIKTKKRKSKIQRKKVSFPIRNNSEPILEKESNPSSEISVSEAPIKEEAQEMRSIYLDADGKIENLKSEEKEISDGKLEEQEVEEKRQYVKHSEKVDWAGVPDFVIEFIDARFKAFNDKHGKILVPQFTDGEKNLLRRGVTDVLEKRAKILSEYADLINLGLAILVTMTPRIIAAMKYKDEPIKVSQNAPNKQKIETKSLISEADRDKQRAMAEYDAMMKNQE